MLAFLLFLLVSTPLQSNKYSKEYGVEYSNESSVEYNFFSFVRQWTPNACYLSSHACTHLIPAMENSWTIHGLWPSIDAERWPSNCYSSSGCPFNSSSIADLVEEMHVEWPTDYSGGDTKFWYHEYCKHGTCCTDLLPTQHDFFSKVLELHHTFNLEEVLGSAGIVPHDHITYTIGQVVDALETGYGAGASQPELWCRFVKDKGVSKQLLFQISLCISKEFEVMECPKKKQEMCTDKQPLYLLPFGVLNLVA